MATAMADNSSVQSSDMHKYLCFDMHNKIYAVSILKVKEIIEHTDVTPMPMMPDFLRGAINLRGSMVPVFDLARRLGMDETEIERRTCIVIIEVDAHGESMDVGIFVDAISQVTDIPPQMIEPAPSFGGNLHTDHIGGMGKVDDGFVVLLNIDQLLSLDDIEILSAVSQQDTALQSESESVAEYESVAEDESESVAEDEPESVAEDESESVAEDESKSVDDKYLTISVSDNILGIDILRIKEIVEYENVCPVPMVPDYIRGVINLRGNVVPVIDLANHIGLQSGKVGKRSCIVMIDIESNDEVMDIGVVVDAVNRVHEINGKDIEQAPAFGSNIRHDFIAGMGRIDHDFVALFDIDKVLDIDELSALGELSMQPDNG
jgi:purine-binding chemotaxis protein CheW